MQVTVKACFSDPILNVMNFLNEVVLDYPQAISFAPGRPAENFFNVEESLGEIQDFVRYRAARKQWSEAKVYADLGQYNKTNGIIQELIAEQLKLDESIEVDPASILVTSGCQEGMAILLAGLFDPARDVLLSSDPTYIGITGLAKILGVPVHPLPSGEHGLEPEAFEQAVADVRSQGMNPRALYDVPDFNNPLGTSMPLESRRQILAIAQREEVLVFEDNPYGMFAYDGEPRPTLKSLDRHRSVIYLGSFSKTLFPGLRVGFLVVDQECQVEGSVEGAEKTIALAEVLSQVKSLTTVNTPPLLQAVVGGTLVRTGGSLKPLMKDKIAFYGANRDHMLAALEQRFGPGSEIAAAGHGGKVTWNRPEGGFFMTMDLPFEFDVKALRTCAAEYGVIVSPVSFFALSPGRERQIRLAFSYVTPEQIDEGIERLAGFIRARLEELAEEGSAA
jgi:(S)-3,5-dihydroxyphenylglycine transaminase